MILYHISTDLNHKGKFTPKIPNGRILGENKSINRVCAGKTIEGCLSSIPQGGSRLASFYKIQKKIDFSELFPSISQKKNHQPKQDLNLTNKKYYNGYRKFKLFKIDTNKLKISKKDIITPEVLKNNNYCEDAHLNKEYWITTKFKVPREDQSIFIIKYFEFYRTEEGYPVIDMTNLNFIEGEIK